jgi:hypothetical protein
VQPRLGASLNRRRVGSWLDALPAPAAHPRAAPPRLVLVVGQLRERRLPALRAYGGGAAHHQVGAGHVQRQAAALGSALPMRLQRGDATASRLGRQGDRHAAVPRRPPRR